MTPRQVEQRLRTIKNRLEKAIPEAEEKTINLAKRKAIQYSSGKWPLKRRRKSEYTYSKRYPFPPPPGPTVINVETGALKASWVVSRKGNKFVLENTVFYERYMRDKIGTARMIPRPIMARIRREVAPERLKYLQTAIRRSIKFP